MEVHGSASSAAPALVAAALAGIDVTFVEADELSADMLGPFDSADLVLRTPRGCVQHAGAVLRYLWLWLPDPHSYHRPCCPKRRQGLRRDFRDPAVLHQCLPHRLRHLQVG